MDSPRVQTRRPTCSYLAARIPTLFPRKGGSSQNSARSAEFQRNRHLIGAIDRNSEAHEYVADCAVSSGNPEKSRRISDPSPHLFYDEGEGSRGRHTRSAEIQRNRHLPVEIGRGYEHHGSAGDCVESSENPGESRRVADPPSGGYCGIGVRFSGIPPDHPRLSEIGRYGGISRLMRLLSIAYYIVRKTWGIPVDR